MEVELKLLLEPDEADRLYAELGPPLRTELQTNRYFDDASRTLGRAGWGLRVRESLVAREPDRVTLTLKHSGEDVGDFIHRPEYECELPEASVEPAGLMEVARGLLPDPTLLPQVEVEEFGRMHNRREYLPLPGSELLLELDNTLWPDQSETIEVELEIDERADADEAQRRLRHLFLEFGIEWRVGRESKLERLTKML